MLRRYVVSSMPAALERIRAELGPDALVVESRQINRRFPWLKPLLEVIATDEATMPRPSDFPTEQVRETVPTRPARTNGHVSSHVAKNGHHPTASLQEDPVLAPSNLVDPLRPFWAALRDQALDEDLVEEVILGAAQESEPATWHSPRLARNALAAQLERRVQTTGAIAVKPEAPTVMAIVGPTGVGKTTTIAKLAASAKSGGFRVALLTIDTYRVGAVQQLKTYGEILEIPVRIAYDPSDLRKSIQDLRDFDLVLIDTAGCGAKNRALLTELERFFSPLETCDVHLAVASGTQLAEMLDTVQAFGNLRLGGLILTKVDEAACMGPALSLAHRSGQPVSYLTTGQSIASDVEIATPRRLAELLVGAEVAA